MKPSTRLIAVCLIVAASVLMLELAGCARLAALRRSLERESGVTEPAARPERGAPAKKPAPRPAPTLEEIAVSEVQWTGVAVSRDGRIFVCFPRWSGDPGTSVGEIRAGGKIWPFPDEEWNVWAPAVDPATHFVCVQSVYVDADDFLWVLDCANAYLEGVVPGGAKLLKIDIRRDRVVQTVSFDQTVAPSGSYLNDVRVDPGRGVAFVTDSGLGAIIVVDLATGRARRVLADHPSTKAEPIALKVDGREWLVDGRAPRINVDGLALDPTGDYLYYHALTGRNLYRIGTQYLRDEALTDRDLGARVESLGTTGATDGMEFGADGYLYLTGIEDGSIRVFASIGNTETVIKDARLLWPDSMARGPGGYLHVTASQLNLGTEPRKPYRLFRFKVEE